MVGGGGGGETIGVEQLTFCGVQFNKVWMSVNKYGGKYV